LQNQVQALQMGLAKPENIYHTLSKQVENSGYKDVQKFFIDPSTSPPQPPQPPPPDPALLVEQMRQQGKAQELQFSAQQEQQKMSIEDQQHQREMQRDMELARYQQEMQAQESRITNQIEAERDIQKAQIQASLDAQKLQFDQWKAELDSSTKITVAQISAQAKTDNLLSAEQAGSDDVNGPMGQPKLSDVMDSLNQIVTHITAPKVVERGADGRAIAINGRPIVRGQDGRISGIQ
jgi:acyl-homoserine lactone acylase PvdQ